MQREHINGEWAGVGPREHTRFHITTDELKALQDYAKTTQFKPHANFLNHVFQDNMFKEDGEQGGVCIKFLDNLYGNINRQLFEAISEDLNLQTEELKKK